MKWIGAIVVAVAVAGCGNNQNGETITSQRCLRSDLNAHVLKALAADGVNVDASRVTLGEPTPYPSGDIQVNVKIGTDQRRRVEIECRDGSYGSANVFTEH